MGLTPLAGLPGATRSGSVDPCLIFHYTDNATRTEGSADKAQGLHVTHAEEILNKHAGWKALTGTTDFKLITANAKSDDPNARLALDLFADRVLNYVGAYHLKLRGEVDALVFAGGIGERSVELRERVGRAVQCLGYVAVQDDLNASVDGQEGPVLDLGNASDARPGHRGKRVLVCRTDEQVSRLSAL
jgi:acetate kinase